MEATQRRPSTSHQNMGPADFSSMASNDKVINGINGLGRSSSKRRGSSQWKRDATMNVLYPSDIVPPAPDVPRAPPISYRDPYGNSIKPRSGGHSRSFSARTYADNAHVPITVQAYETRSRSNSAGKDDRHHRRGSVDGHNNVKYADIKQAVPASYATTSAANDPPTEPRNDGTHHTSSSKAHRSNSTSRRLPDPPNPQTSHSSSRRTASNSHKTHTRSNSRAVSVPFNATVEQKREWAPDRSPLQKLEVTLGDISKEEKRARVAEAEMQVKETNPSQGGSRSNGEKVSGSSKREHAHHNSTRHAVADGANMNRNHSTRERSRNQPSTSRKDETRHPSMDHHGDHDYYETRRTESRSNGNGSQSQRPPKTNGQQSSAHRHNQSSGKPVVWEYETREQFYVPPGKNEAVSTGYEVRDKSTNHHDRSNSDQSRGFHETIISSSGTTGAVVGRSNSRKLHKDPPQVKSIGGGNNGWSLNVAQDQQTQNRRNDKSYRAYDDQLDDALPRESVEVRRGNSLSYDRPPQKIGGPSLAPQSVNPDGVQHRHHLTGIFSREPKNQSISIQDPRAAAPRLDEWKTAGAARLMGEALDLSDPASTKAWWEGGSTRKRSSSKSHYIDNVDGRWDSDSQPAYFRPQLYLKCGPLLRYTGIRREKITKSNSRKQSQPVEREVWRGSVMIVTADSASSYETVPTLRLFAQPMDLIPPPPEHIDTESGQQLAPEYVDPIAGLPKLSRTGKTLYVKPIDHIDEGKDLSRLENGDGLFEETPSPIEDLSQPELTGIKPKARVGPNRLRGPDGEKLGLYSDVKGIRLHTERGLTFWRFNLEVELGETQARIAYKINKGPAIGFWVPARGQSMNIMFHSCNGFSLTVNPDQFCGPDPMWRDVLNTHQTRPFHVMIGGGDQIYNDAVMRDCPEFAAWLALKNPVDKHRALFSPRMQEELELTYLERYCMWFSQGIFSMANSQIPMVNMWDDHDIIDGFGSYPHHFMRAPVFSGIGAVAFKYYMLFQHQSVPEETQADEPSWLLGAESGPYIHELSRSVFMFLGKKIAFLGLDCRTERTKDEVLSEDTYDLVFEKLEREIIKGETKHLIVLLGVPIAYPRLVWLETLLTSKLMNPVKAMGRAGLFGKGLLNKFDGGVEILDDLDDHWTAKEHKTERNWFVEELQELAAEKSVRITILGGDVHLAAIGQFYSNPKLRVPKHHDHRYIPNVISSAIVNTPPPEMLADVLNKRNKVHHLNPDTDESMIPMFTHDTDGKRRNNKHLLPRRNWCSIKEYQPGSTPPSTPSPVLEQQTPDYPSPPGSLQRTMSLSSKSDKKPSLFRRLSRKKGPPIAYDAAMERAGLERPSTAKSTASSHAPGSYFPPQTRSADISRASSIDNPRPPRPGQIMRRATNFSEKAAKKGGYGEDEMEVDLEHGLDITLNCEVRQTDPSGITAPYRLLVPALWYSGERPPSPTTTKAKGVFGIGKATGSHRNSLADQQGLGEWGQEHESTTDDEGHEEGSGQEHGYGGGYSGVEAYKEKKQRKWF
ncbi:MAG: hypothetical protein M1834_007204 [Cirrosporium novae-zelandiae]|nr:MAG: hypothetical protein M1834_007204 [Cirrosporium novae-zelandiae]